MKTVTYGGPKDPRDPTTEYVSGDHVLRLGIPTDVPDEVAKRLAGVEGQNFEVQSSKGGAGKKK